MAEGEGGRGAGGSGATGAGTNLWDVLRAALVLAALVVLVLLVARHYGQDAQKAATVLGIAAPVLAAVVGGTLGYYAGNTTGSTSGAAVGAAKVKQQMAASVKTLDSHIAALPEAHQSAAASEAIAVLKHLVST